MSLISKPFDDSGVDMVDAIAAYGLCISKRLEQFRQRNRLRGEHSKSLTGLCLASALCDTVSGIIDASSYEPYRAACARAADTIFFETMISEPTASNDRPHQEPSNGNKQSREMAQHINSILADDQILPADGSVPLQTVLLALVWSALSFAVESLPADQARVWVRERIANSASSASYH